MLKELEKRPAASKTNKKYVPQETRFGRRKDSTRNSRSSSIYARASSAEKHKDEEVVTDWPPSKYKDVKGTGYGTTWSPKTTRRTNFNESVYTIANNQKKKKKLTHSSSNLNLSSSYLGFDDFKSHTNKFDQSAEVAQLKGKSFVLNPKIRKRKFFKIFIEIFLIFNFRIFKFNTVLIF